MSIAPPSKRLCRLNKPPLLGQPSPRMSVRGGKLPQQAVIAAGIRRKALPLCAAML
jgi:hypothetical protein